MVAVLLAIYCLVEVEKSEQIKLSLKIGELAIKSGQIDAGTIPFFMKEAQVVFLLKVMHFVLLLGHFLFETDEFVGDCGSGVFGLLRTHLLLHHHVFVHTGIEIGRGVERRQAGGRHDEDRGFRDGADFELHLFLSQVGAERMDACVRALFDFATLHQFLLGSEEVH